MSAGGTKSKQITTKITLDGDIVRLRFACKGHLATKSFSEMSVGGRKDILEWISEQYDEQLTKMKQEAANGEKR